MDARYTLGCLCDATKGNGDVRFRNKEAVDKERRVTVEVL